MQCTKCHQPMECVDFGVDIRICRCTSCHGLFCNMNTLSKMRDEWLTDTVLDIGDAKRGAVHNEMTDVPCPECGNPLVVKRRLSQERRKRESERGDA